MENRQELSSFVHNSRCYQYQMLVYLGGPLVRNISLFDEADQELERNTIF